jgi:hypothetical protein
MHNYRRNSFLFLAALLAGPALQAGIYSGATTDVAYTQLVNDVESAYTLLTNQMAMAEADGISTAYAQVTKVTLEQFKDKFTPWDRANPSSIADAYTEKTSFAADDPVYAAYGAAGLPFDELADCIEIAQAATTELQQQINGAVVLQEPPDFSTGAMTLNGTHYELEGKKVIPSRFFWQPENDEQIWQAYGRMGASFYGLYYNMTGPDTPNNVSVLNDVNNLATFGASPVEFWHATVVGADTNNWMLRDYPEVLGDGSRYFNEYDIDNPLVRQWESNLFNQVLAPAVSNLGSGLRYHLLNNEPRFPIRQGNGDSAHNVSSYTTDNFAAWLLTKYTTLTNLNTVYGTNYVDFSAAATANYVVDDGVDEDLQGGPIWYDWCKFNQERVTDWLEFLNDTVKAVDSTPSTYIKVWGEGSIHTTWQDQGIDYEVLAKMVDLPGSDSQCNPLRSEYDTRDEQDWRNRYAFEWRAQAVMMDFIKSMSPEKPYLDAEWHGLVGARWRDFHMEDKYVRAILWMAAQQGLSGINAWFWNRSTDNSYRLKAEFAGSPVVQPIMLNAYGRTMKEINAHAETFAAMVPALRHYVVYYNNDSAIQDVTYSDNMTDVYEALKLLNVPVGFTTPTELASVTNAGQTLIVPRTEFISDSDLAGLQAAASNGVAILLVDPADSFTQTELGAARGGGAGFTPFATVSHGEVYAMADDLEAALATRKPSLPVACDITDASGDPAYGVICCQSEDPVRGGQTVSLINLSQQPRTVTLSMDSQGVVTNLITGQAGSSQMTLAPQDVRLLHLPVHESVNPQWNSYIAQYGLSGEKTANFDYDSQNDWGEYVFGGDPTNPAVIGWPVFFDAASGDFTVHIRNDSALVARVLSTTNLVAAVWMTNETISIAANDGGLGTHVSAQDVSEPTLFWKVAVDEINRPPAFSSGTFSMPDATAYTAYAASIAGNASDPESDPLTFSKVSGPDWLTVDPNGAISGTPGNDDAGPNAFTVQVSAAGGADTATLNISVLSVPGLELSITDANAIGAAVSAGSVAAGGTASATTFTVSGLTIDADGTANDSITVLLSVTGNSEVVYDEADGRYEYTDGSVIGGSDWMEFDWSMQSVTLSDPTQILRSEFSITALEITNGSTGDVAEVTLDDGTPYEVNPLLSGALIPQTSGASKLKIARIDNSFSAADVSVDITMYIEAGSVNQPPVFSADPFSKPDAIVGTAYSDSIAAAASDPESDTLTFSKISGPDWLTVESDGSISGTPTEAGTDQFTVQVSAAGGTDTATMNIAVINLPQVNLSLTHASFAGAVASTGSVAVSGTAAATLYTISGLTIDADGTANDSITFLLSITGNSEVVYDVADDRYEYFDGTIIAANDWMEFEFSMPSFTLSGGAQTLDSAFSIAGLEIVNGGDSDGADITLDDGTPYNVFPLPSGTLIPQTAGASKLRIARTGNNFTVADISVDITLN